LGFRILEKKLEDWLPKLFAPALAAMVAAYLGFIHGRWSKHKEIIYQRKIDLYSKLVEKLLEFTMTCFPRHDLKQSDYIEVMRKFTDTQNLFFQASLLMPQKLDKDIKEKFWPVNERIKKLHTFFVRLEKIKNGTQEEELDVQNFPELKAEMIAALDDFKELPGPFFPLVEAVPSIVSMLKKDLGINILDAKFYK
jgi:hypothetical protein